MSHCHYSRKEKKFYCGVDLHQKKSFLYVVDQEGKKREAREIVTSQENFTEFFTPYPLDDITVAVEISSLTFWFCDVLKRLGIESYVVNTLENRYISGSVKKTDKEDARKLSIQLCKDILPEPIYIPSKEVREVRRLISFRHFLVKTTTRIINRTCFLLANHEIRTSKRALTTQKKWKQLLQAFGENASSKSNPNDINQPDETVKMEFTTLYNQFSQIQSQISRIEKSLLHKSNATPRLSNMYRLLLTIPGIGAITSSALIGCVGDIGRFKSGRAMTSYLGLCPKVRESAGKSLGSSGITKRGNSRLRGYLTQAAIAVLRSKRLEAEPLKAWYDQLRKKKGWRTARVALARKLTAVAFGVLKTNQYYDPSKVSKTTHSKTEN